MKKAVIFISMILSLFVLQNVVCQEQLSIIKPDNRPAGQKFFKARRKVANEYIVAFRQDNLKETVQSLTDKLAKRYSIEVLSYYQYALKGFAGRMTEKNAFKLGQNPAVDYIEENDLSESEGMALGLSNSATSSLVNQQTLPFPGNWGLDRIDQRNLPLNRTYSYSNTGAGVTAYIIDTGINVFHTEFQGRITDITDLVLTNDHPTGYYGQDCVGHGTHVAAILGGTTFGVAKGVSLHPIRVGELQDCYNPFQIRPGISNSKVIDAIELILRNPKRPAVVNFSIYDYDGDFGVDNAVRELIRAGLPVVAGVGDQAGDVGGSPARVWEVIAVGATNAADKRIPWTEAGPALDVFAPGDTILSAWYDNPTATEYLSGTSMATPHVSGVVARYLQNNPTATPAQVHQFITSTATAGIIQNVPVGVQNKLLYIQP